jgi:hypothetical protein
MTNYIVLEIIYKMEDYPKINDFWTMLENWYERNAFTIALIIIASAHLMFMLVSLMILRSL